MNNVRKIDTINQLNQANNKGTTKTVSNNFSSFLGESKSLDDVFQKAADKYDVSADLLKSIGKAESDFREKVVSRSGAVGIMQLMPATAKYLGVNDSYDAEQNIMGGAKYVKELLDKYNGDTSLALAAYNAGMGNVSKYGGIPPFKETQNYVKKVLNYMQTDIQTGVTVTVSNQNNSAAQISSGYSTAISNTPVYTSSNLDLTLAKLEKDSSLDTDSLFSYDKYLEFLELYMKFIESKESEEEKEHKYSNNTTMQAFNYSSPILNLLNQPKI